jgi:hypothetical protein
MRRLVAIVAAIALLFCARASLAQEVGFQSYNVTSSSGAVGGWQGFNPTWIPSVVLWMRSDLGVTAGINAVSATGTSPPTVTLSGTPSTRQSSAATPYVELDCTTGGALGTWAFTVKLNGSTVSTNVLSAASVTLTGTGLTATIATGTASTNDVWRSNITVSSWGDQSGYNRPFSQATASAQPIYAGSSLFFQLNNSVLAPSTIASGYLPQSAAERIAVFANNGNSGGAFESVWGSNGNAENVPYTDGKIYDGFAATTRPCNGVSASGYTLTSTFLYDTASGGGAFDVWINSNAFFAGSGTYGVASGYPNLGSTLNFSGTVWEYIVFDAVLDASSRWRANVYASNRYGVAL